MASCGLVAGLGEAVRAVGIDIQELLIRVFGLREHHVVLVQLLLAGFGGFFALFGCLAAGFGGLAGSGSLTLALPLFCWVRKQMRV